MTVKTGNPQGRVHLPQGRPDPEEFISRTIAGKQRLFGIWRGAREGKWWDAYAQAVAAAETMEGNRKALATDKNLTPQGVRSQLVQDSLPFFAEKRKLAARTQARRAELASRAQGVLDETVKGYDTNTLSHHRLVEAYKAMSGAERARITTPSFMQQNPELARALLAEPPIVTGLDTETREQLRTGLLTGEQLGQLAEIETEVQQMKAVERAFGTAREAIAEIAELTEKQANTLEEEYHADPEPEDDDTPPPQTLAQGAPLKLMNPDEVEDDEEAA